MNAQAPDGAKPLSRTDPLPLYAQLAEVLRDNITGGHYEPGAALPSEADLCAFFDVSRTAVRQALDELVADGLIVKERGRGSFVRAARPTGLLVTEVTSFTDEMALAGRNVATEVLANEAVELPADVPPMLAVPMGAKAVRLDRVRLVDGDPTVVVRTHLLSPRFDDALDVDFRAVSLYAWLRDQHDVVPVGGYRRLDAVAADRRTASLLGIRQGAPLMRMTATNEDQQRVPFEHFEALYRADRITFEMLVERPDAGATARLLPPPDTA